MVVPHDLSFSNASSLPHEWQPVQPGLFALSFKRTANCNQNYPALQAPLQRRGIHAPPLQRVGEGAGG